MKILTLHIHLEAKLCVASSAETEKNMCASHKDLGIFSTMRTIYVDFVLFGHAKTLLKT